MRIFTIGYGGLRPSQFEQVLQEHSIKSVVDIRIWPIRASMGSYIWSESAERGIRALLAGAGIAYFSLLEIGNPFKDLPDWKDRYRRLLHYAGDVLIERLRGIPGPLCLLCCEKEPKDCHRLILAELLEKRGHEVEHLVVQTPPRVRQRARRPRQRPPNDSSAREGLHTRGPDPGSLS
jgi:uncharacterized protein (DUF488 family)